MQKRRTVSTALAAPAAPEATLALVIPIAIGDTAKELGALLDAIFKLGSLLNRLPEEQARANAAYLSAILAAAQAPAIDANLFVEARKKLDTDMQAAITREAATREAIRAVTARLKEIEGADAAAAREVFDQRIDALTLQIAALQPDTAALEEMKHFIETERKALAAAIKAAAAPHKS